MKLFQLQHEEHEEKNSFNTSGCSGVSTHIDKNTVFVNRTSINNVGAHTWNMRKHFANHHHHLVPILKKVVDAMIFPQGHIVNKFK